MSLATEKMNCLGGDEVHGTVVTLVEKVEEYRGTLEQMDEHETMLHLRETMKQGSQVCLCLFWIRL